MSRTPLPASHILLPDHTAGALDRGGGYTIVRQIDAGGFGITYEAVKAPGGRGEVSANLWLADHERVVVKEFYPDEIARRDGFEVVPDTDDDEIENVFNRSFQRFRREAERLCFLSCLRALRAAAAVPPRDAADEQMIERIRRRLEPGAGQKFSHDPGSALRLVGQLGGGLKEAAHKAIRSASLPIVYDFFESQGTAYYVMEYLEGGTLKDRLRAARQRGTRTVTIDDVNFKIADPWPADRLRAFTAVALDALEELHSGLPDQQLVHCDLKPGNIMFRAAASDSPVLIDFGLARNVIGERSMSLAGGTAVYAPVEIDPTSRSQSSTRSARGGGPAAVGPWTDIYSLAVILRILATGLEGQAIPSAHERRLAQLYGDPDPFEQLPPLPDTVLPAFARALAHGLRLEARDRPQRIADWRRDFGLAPPAPVQPGGSRRRVSDGWRPQVDGDDFPEEIDDELTRPDRSIDQRRSDRSRHSQPAVPDPLTPPARRSGLSSNQILAIVIGVAILGFLVLALRNMSGGSESTKSADSGNAATTTTVSNASEASMGDTMGAPATPVPQVQAPVQQQQQQPGQPPVAPQVVAPPPVVQAPPDIPAPRVPAAVSRTFSGIGISVRTITDKATLQQYALQGLNPNDAVVVTSVTKDVDIRVGDVFTHSCDGSSALAALSAGDNGERVCLKADDEKSVNIN